jgi:type I restriction enzyme S subunit
MNNNTYKQTEIGLIPSDWEVKKILDFGKVFTGNTPDTSIKDNYGSEFKFVSPYDLGKGKYILETEKKLSKKGFEKSRKFPLGSVLFCCIGSTIGKCGIAIDNLTSNQQINAVVVKDNFCNEFLYYELEFNVEKIKLLAGEQAVPIINKSQFSEIKLKFPPLPEQQKIAKILSTWDTAIDQCKTLIDQLKNRNKGLAQKLLTGKMRVKGFEGTKWHKTDLGLCVPEDWKIITVADIFKERSEKSNNQEDFPLFSLTIEKGLTEKTDRYERSFLLKDIENNEYKLVHKDDILFNPMNLRFGAIAISERKNIVSVSAYYNVISKYRDVNVNYFIALFKTDEFISFYDRISIGSLIEKKRVHLSNFLKLQIPLPSTDEQNAIMNILDSATAELNQSQQKLAHLQTQKKGLMQQLLTGKTRVRV